MDESIQKQLETLQPRVGRFHHLAEAMRRGAAKTPLAIAIRYDERCGGTCALGAMLLGLGEPLSAINNFDMTEEQWAMYHAYHARYGDYLHFQSNQQTFTREQIADRIDAL